jgi:hypothetical protein
MSATATPPATPARPAEAPALTHAEQRDPEDEVRREAGAASGASLRGAPAARSPNPLAPPLPSRRASGRRRPGTRNARRAGRARPGREVRRRRSRSWRMGGPCRHALRALPYSRLRGMPRERLQWLPLSRKRSFMCSPERPRECCWFCWGLSAEPTRGRSLLGGCGSWGSSTWRSPRWRTCIGRRRIAAAGRALCPARPFRACRCHARIL